MIQSLGRRTRITLVILLVIALAGIAAWRTLFVSTDTAIRHAEAFLFRRMTVARLAEEGKYRFFFSTNRVPGSGSGSLEQRFTPERGETLQFGYFDAEVQPSLGLGMLINPTEWFQNEEIRLGDVNEQATQDFLAALRERVENSPHRGLLVVVHGFRERFPSALRKTVFVGHVLDLNAPVLLFDWPGNQGSSPIGYRRARQVASESGAELAQLLELISREVQPESLWLIANSLGGQVVVKAFDELYERQDQSAVRLEDVVLTAPDIDREAFDARFRDRIAALTDNLTVYVSSNDRALVMSRLINRAARGGESTLQPDQFDEAARVVEMTSPDSDLVTLVDVTPVNRTRNFHNFSLETPEFFDDLFLRLVNDDTPRSRPIYQVTTPEGRVYWVLTRGR